VNWFLPAGGGLAALAMAAAAIAWTRHRRRPPAPIETAEEAAFAAEAALAGFQVYSAVLATNGQGALAVGRENRVAVITRDREKLAVHEIPWKAVRATPYGLIVETGDSDVGDIALAGIDALEVRRLTP
jgi:hypothetical protein